MPLAEMIALAEASASGWLGFERDVKADYERVVGGGATWTNTDGVLFRPTWQWNYDLYVDEIRLSNSKTVIHNTLTGGSIGQIACSREVTATGGNGSLGLTDTWYHYDHIGNVMNLSNSSGAMVSGSIQHQDAWGNVLASTTTGAWASTFSGRHLTTKEYDPDAGLYYLANRWFDSQMGTFTSADPTRSLYNYTYPDMNPITSIDPTGYGNDYKDAVKAAEKCGLKVVEGSKHAKVYDAAGRLVTTIPRHASINRWTLRGIMKAIGSGCLGTCAFCVEFVLCPNTAYAPEINWDDWPTTGPGIFPPYDPGYHMDPPPHYWPEPGDVSPQCPRPCHGEDS